MRNTVIIQNGIFVVQSIAVLKWEKKRQYFNIDFITKLQLLKL
jgi:hypothetical protein